MGAASKENKNGCNPFCFRIAAILFLLRLFSFEDCYRNFQEEKKKSKNNGFFLEIAFGIPFFLLQYIGHSIEPRALLSQVFGGLDGAYGKDFFAHGLVA